MADIQTSDSALVVGAEDRRDERLRAAVANARRSAFYAKHLAACDFSGRADIDRLPLTLKNHLRDASPFGMLAVPAESVDVLRVLRLARETT